MLESLTQDWIKSLAPGKSELERKIREMRFHFRLLLFLPILCSTLGSFGQRSADREICASCVHADLEFLASDELHGRGSGTRDEHLAALYAASLFESFGLDPAGENGTYLERAPLPNPLPARLAEHLKQHGFDQNQRTDTWNVLAMLKGSDPSAAKEAILLTAHLDHLGVGEAVHGDSIYNGADDDASGTTAVLELARVLSKGPRPKRSILFVLFGSEELGGYGNRYFLEHPPIPLTQIVTNLEFEMIGRPDPALPGRTLWLTGYERSNLGPELARHGAAISADPHPDQHFFYRSDNIALAKKGIVAQTVSSFGLHKDYHQPSDEIGKIDFDFLTHSIQSMVEPVRWLADSGFRPEWVKGGKP
jgi:Zn-dependent M28 family amino/carboxypeptidase